MTTNALDWSIQCRNKMVKGVKRKLTLSFMENYGNFFWEQEKSKPSLPWDIWQWVGRGRQCAPRHCWRAAAGSLLELRPRRPDCRRCAAGAAPTPCGRRTARTAPAYRPPSPRSLMAFSSPPLCGKQTHITLSLFFFENRGVGTLIIFIFRQKCLSPMQGCFLQTHLNHWESPDGNSMTLYPTWFNAGSLTQQLRLQLLDQPGITGTDRGIWPLAHISPKSLKNLLQN